ncbi:hypothetical protein MNB_SV-15-452 [hydrothermal vent metagenome]|uniref:NodB homology domain-containing protein n=1 Tax=hydrothermal vent metagenome TaxID=652676 RepID=A0A1W1EIW4_9ZZZZ
MLKFLFALIIILSVIMINLFQNNSNHCNIDENSYIDKKFTIACNPLYKPLPNRKFIYLSFDDGPLNGSQNIDRLALKYKIYITVFIVGKHVFMNDRYHKYFDNYIKNPFIEVDNHSYSHANNQYKKFYNNPQNVFDDINKSMNILNLKNKIVRLPGRNVWAFDNRTQNIKKTKETITLLKNDGFKMMGWDIEWKYHPITKEPIGTAEEFFKKLVKRINSNDKLVTPSNIVILLHDPMFRKKSKVKELEKLITLIKANKNYVLVPLSMYPII